LNTSSLQSQINIHSRPLQDAMKAASKIQLELIEAYKKQNPALNTIIYSAITPPLEHKQLATLQSAINQVRTVLSSNEKNAQLLKSTMIKLGNINNAQLSYTLNQLRTVFKDQAILNSSLYVTNEEISSEIVSEIDEISDYVEETVIALTNNDGITRQNYFEGLNRLWNTVLYFISKHSTALLLLANLIYTDLISPINQALTSKYIIDEFIEKKPETVSEAKNVLKDIPMNKELKTNYRMVIKDTLVVRTRPKTNSNVAYVLDKSSIVFVEEKKKNWSKVLFRNEAGEDQSGWVYTRYIKKLD